MILDARYEKVRDDGGSHAGRRNIGSSPTGSRRTSALTFYRLARLHHRNLKSTKMIERLNEELRRRTRVVHIFPNITSCPRFTGALCAETQEARLEDNRYVNMDLRRECPAVATTSSRQPSTDPSRVLRRESRFRLLRSFAGDATQPNA